MLVTGRQEVSFTCYLGLTMQNVGTRGPTIQSMKALSPTSRSVWQLLSLLIGDSSNDGIMLHRHRQNGGHGSFSGRSKCVIGKAWNTENSNEIIVQNRCLEW